MNPSLRVISIVLVLILLGAAAAAYVYMFSDQEKSAANATYETVGGGEPLGGGVRGGDFTPAAVIRRTENGYEPAEVTIREGETVSFVNDSSSFHWPASDVHPTHTIYSEFDPLEPVAPGDTWSFTFTKAGEWRFHDHIRANLKGVVTVLPRE